MGFEYLSAVSKQEPLGWVPRRSLPVMREAKSTKTDLLDRVVCHGRSRKYPDQHMLAAPRPPFLSVQAKEATAKTLWTL